MQSLGQARVVTGILIWLAAALMAGATGVTSSMEPPAPQAILFGLVIALLLLFWKSSHFRLWNLESDIRLLVGVHLTRFVGFYFLYLYSLNRLPYDFAVLGGWGDIIIAAGALFIIPLVRINSRAGWLIGLVWNTLGFLDILFVVSTATSLAMADPGSMSELLKLPLSLLPTFLVPIIIFTHIVIFVRLWKSYRAEYKSI